MIKLNRKNKKIISFLKYIILFIELLLIKDFINIKKYNSSILINNLKNDSLKIINNIKINLQNQIYKTFNKNITSINSMYIIGRMRFGNYFIGLNNAIIFCEFLGCKRLIIKNDFINHNIFYQRYNLSIESNYSFNYTDKDSMIINIYFFFHLILLI